MLWLCCHPKGASEQAAAPSAAHNLCAWALLAFTPRVVIIEEAVLAEVSGSLRLFSGLNQLLVSLSIGLDAIYFEVSASGLTALGALTLARSGAKLALDRPMSPTAWAQSLNCLPLAVLSAAQPHLAMLHRAGLRRLGDVSALPRGPLARRFGTALLHALDQAHGQRPEAFDWLQAPEGFDERLELPSRIDDATALLFAAQRLLVALQLWLQARRSGVTAIELSWRHDFAARSAGEGGQLVVRTAQPMRHTNHLERLLREQLNHTQLAGPVGEIRLRAIDVLPLTEQSQSFLPDTHAQGSQVQQLVERLSARLGAQAVQCVRACSDWRLEHAQAWQAVVAQPDPETAPPGADKPNLMTNMPLVTGSIGPVAIKKILAGLKKTKADAPHPNPFAPSFLLAQPLPLLVRQHRPHYQGQLTLLAGPQRVETVWWQAEVSKVADGQVPEIQVPDIQVPDIYSRDYFLAHSQGAGFVLIYKQRLPKLDQINDSFQWSLAGLYA